jgi:hypothetical protein
MANPGFRPVVRVVVVALVVTGVLAGPRQARADQPVGMNGLDFRLGYLSHNRNLALSDGPHVVEGNWVVTDFTGHYSLIDRYRGGDSPFRIGDYIAVGLGVGYGDADDEVEKFWYTLQLAGGLQAAYRLNDNIDGGVRAYLHLKLEPFYTGMYTFEAWGRMGQLMGTASYGFYDARRDPPATPEENRLGYETSSVLLDGRYLYDGFHYLGAQIYRRVASEDGAGEDLVEWQVAVTFGIVYQGDE